MARATSSCESLASAAWGALDPWIAVPRQPVLARTQPSPMGFLAAAPEAAEQGGEPDGPLVAEAVLGGSGAITWLGCSDQRLSRSACVEMATSSGSAS